MEKQKPVVPVFGPYFNGNFGDDLMGHLMATCLEDAGYRPRLWRGPDNTFRGRKWDVASDMPTFIKDAKCVVFGGGLPFCNSDFTPYWDAISEMVDACEAANIPIIAVSVGSHGHHESMHPAAEKFVASSAFTAASLRLKVDVEWLRSKGKEVEYIPDIVLTSMPYKPRKELKNVLLCMGVGSKERPLINWMVRRLQKRGIKVSTVGQFAEGFPMSENYYHTAGTKVVNDGPDSVAAAIEKADVVVATGLHIGITALSNGAEFVAYRAAGKAATFMGQCGRGHQVIPVGNKLTRIFRPYQLYKKILQVNFAQDDSTFKEMADAAQGHCRFMLEQVGKMHEDGLFAE